jgi:hypothetical protein
MSDLDMHIPDCLEQYAGLVRVRQKWALILTIGSGVIFIVGFFFIVLLMSQLDRPASLVEVIAIVMTILSLAGLPFGMAIRYAISRNTLDLLAVLQKARNEH